MCCRMIFRFEPIHPHQKVTGVITISGYSPNRDALSQRMNLFRWKWICNRSMDDQGFRICNSVDLEFGFSSSYAMGIQILALPAGIRVNWEKVMSLRFECLSLFVYGYWMSAWFEYACSAWFFLYLLWNSGCDSDFTFWLVALFYTVSFRRMPDDLPSGRTHPNQSHSASTPSPKDMYRPAPRSKIQNYHWMRCSSNQSPFVARFRISPSISRSRYLHEYRSKMDRLSAEPDYWGMISLNL